MQIINWELLKSPYNWITVFLMCSFALIFLALVFPQPAAPTPSTLQTS